MCALASKFLKQIVSYYCVLFCYEGLYVNSYISFTIGAILAYDDTAEKCAKTYSAEVLNDLFIETDIKYLHGIFIK